MPRRYDDVAVDAQTVRDLVDRSFALRFNDRGGMFRAASRAVALAERSSSMPPDLRGAAWIQFGNVLRIAGKRRDAEKAFRVALKHVATGSDPSTRAHLFEVWSSLARAEKRFDEALSLLEEALQLYRGIQDSLGETRVLLLMGACNRDAKRFVTALEQFQAAADRLSPETDVQLYFGATHGLVETLTLAGRTNLATASYTFIGRIIENVQEPVLKAKDAWVRGRLWAKLGQHEAAEYAYHEALSIYESLPIAPELPELRAEIKRVLGGL